MVILVALDEKQRSTKPVSVAYDLATAYDDTLVALHVIPEEDFEAHRETMSEIADFQDFSFKQEQATAARFAKQVVDEILDDLDPDRVDTEGRIGVVADEILTAADSMNPRYLVVGGTRRSPTGKAIFGSTTQKILLNADCPVVTVMTD